MTALTPQLIVFLDPQGNLAVELPGSQGTRRKIILRQSEAGATLMRMLEAQAREGAEIGLDGAPTAAQVKHWERHAIWASSQCRFCIAEGRATPDRSRKRHQTIIEKRADGVEIKKVAPGRSGQSKLKTNVASDALLKNLGV